MAACLAAAPATADPGPPNRPPDAVPPRTALSVRTPLGLDWGTPNQYETRSALSTAKLYIVDYALRHGDDSAGDLELAERMIRYSDDAAASALSAKYPAAIDAVAAEYALAQTRSGPGDWSTAVTSTADLATFLAVKQSTDPTSPILEWMATAAPTAADGTAQNWGTARLPGVVGTKWGWSDLPPWEVASVSFGPGFSVAAHTRGTPEEQTADVLGAFPEMVREALRMLIAVPR
ncbi:hypothetical protein IT779_03810 [Nocardia sp. NEAU-351]|uniref:Uncharacterized protein n=1 Tax=Nocardia bovistercoris TaxID=2785916 RepID=A0A931I7Y6_9NOCA|nr:hypothetical protein [Nocardia bovistercoris]